MGVESAIAGVPTVEPGVYEGYEDERRYWVSGQVSIDEESGAYRVVCFDIIKRRWEGRLYDDFCKVIQVEWPAKLGHYNPLSDMFESVNFERLDSEPPWIWRLVVRHPDPFALDPRSGVYKHYRGGFYWVSGQVVHDAESDVARVLYWSLKKRVWWARRYDDFTCACVFPPPVVPASDDPIWDEAHIPWRPTPRFEYVGGRLAWWKLRARYALGLLEIPG